MDHDSFIGQVQQRARLDSRGAAERATRATLETLGERLTAGEAQNLAAQLPSEIGEHLRRTAPAGPEGMDLSGFLARVGEREGVGYPQAAFHARCVIEVVEDATTGGLVTKAREQLPEDYDQLFDAGRAGAVGDADGRPRSPGGPRMTVGGEG